MLCIHDEVRSSGTLGCCQFVLLGYHFPPLFRKKIAYSKRMTLRHLVFFCRIKPLKDSYFALTFFQETRLVFELKVASGKPKRKHCSKRISQEQEEKENIVKSPDHSNKCRIGGI